MPENKLQIQGGRYAGKKLLLPDAAIVRPSAARLRGALFNILNHNFQLDWPKVMVLDAFAGSGALGLEAFSAGAKLVAFCENNVKAGTVLIKNIESFLNSNDRGGCLQNEKKQDYLDFKSLKNGAAQNLLLFNDFFNFKANVRFDVIFIDPPYVLNLYLRSLQNLIKNNLINGDSLIVIELDANQKVDPLWPLNILMERKYSASKLVFAKIT